MNFFIGDSIKEINEQDNNIIFSDELVDYIYKMRNYATCDMSKLYQIHPYSDVEISKNDLPQIIEICEYILDAEMLINFDKSNEGIEMVKNLLEIAQMALSRNQGLVSIGD